MYIARVMLLILFSLTADIVLPLLHTLLTANQTFQAKCLLMAVWSLEQKDAPFFSEMVNNLTKTIGNFLYDQHTFCGLNLVMTEP